MSEDTLVTVVTIVGAIGWGVAFLLGPVLRHLEMERRIRRADRWLEKRLAAADADTIDAALGHAEADIPDPPSGPPTTF